LPIDVGDILDGRYLIKNMIAEGGMGTVYSGVHTKLGKNVAIKILKAKHIEDREQITRFMQEAQAAAELHHRNIVDVIDIGTTPDGAPYFVMELLVGESLRERMKTHLPMPPREIGYIIKQTLAGLGAAHMRGIIHRDIKPSNIFIAREIDGREIVKILDFGISKLQKKGDDPEGNELTEDGTVLGTPLYMSPEQAAGKRELVDHRTDIYACGVILYKALTGVHPYKGRNYNEVMHSIFTSEPEKPSTLNPQISPEMEEVIMKAMARELGDRFQSAEEFASSMGAFMVETTQAGLVLPKALKTQEAHETPPSFRVPQSGVELHRPTPTPSSPRIISPISGPSIIKGGSWDDVAGLPESSRVSHRLPIYPWVLILPFAVVLLIVGGVLLIVAGRYFSSRENKKMDIGKTVVTDGEYGKKGGVKNGAKDSGNILLTLTDLPKGSQVFVDNILEESNPIKIPKSLNSVKIRIEAEGFVPFETEIVPSTDITLPVSMQSKKTWKRGGKKRTGKEGQQLDLLTDFPE